MPLRLRPGWWPAGRAHSAMSEFADQFKDIPRVAWRDSDSFQSILASDAVQSLAGQTRIHRVAFFDALSTDCSDPMGCLGIARCAAMARRQVPIKEGLDLAESGRELMVNLLAFKWPESRTQELVELVSIYVRTGYLQVNEPVKGRSANGSFIEADSALEFALRTCSVPKVQALLQTGADLGNVPSKDIDDDGVLVAKGDVLGYLATRRSFFPDRLPAIAALLQDALMQRAIGHPPAPAAPAPTPSRSLRHV